MRIVYAYAAPRDREFERSVAEGLAGRFGRPDQPDAIESSDGTVTVTLAFEGVSTPGEDVAATLRLNPRIVEAAEESFGEGA
jgi:hypothetical protein